MKPGLGCRGQREHRLSSECLPIRGVRGVIPARISSVAGQREWEGDLQLGGGANCQPSPTLTQAWPRGQENTGEVMGMV